AEVVGGGIELAGDHLPRRTAGPQFGGPGEQGVGLGRERTGGGGGGGHGSGWMKDVAAGRRDVGGLSEPPCRPGTGERDVFNRTLRSRMGKSNRRKKRRPG